MTMRTVARLVLWAHRRLAPYRDTRYLLLCALGGRKSGRVTVGESRLPAGMVLVAIHGDGERGIAEARLMWPQLSEEEFAVLGQLARDIGEEERPEPDVLRADLVDALRAGSETPSLDEIADTVLVVLTAHGVVDGGGNG